jgi:Flp pilus assembly protein TadD
MTIRLKPLAGRTVLIALCAALLSGCATRRSADPDTTGSIGAASAGQLEALGDRYKDNPGDKATVMAYARSLGLATRWPEAVAVLRDAVLKSPGDKEIAAAYGKALAANGNFEEALKVVRQTNSDTNPDWRLLSAEGAILDQLNQPADARRAYEMALKISPDEPSVVNNLALSYLLTNEPKRAEDLLRKASASPRADGRIRQNLALALGLQGKFAEAEQIAVADLPKAEADANMAYLKSMMAQANSWQAIKKADKAKS